MKRMQIFLLIGAMAILLGCADSHTTGTEKDTDLKVTINVTQYANNTGNVNINPGVDYASATGDTKQDTANTAETPTKVDLNLDDVNNPVTRITQAVDDKVKSNVSEKVAEITAAEPTTPVQPESSNTEDVTLKLGHNKQYSWLAKEGKDYSSPMTVTVPGCGAYVITDTTKKWTESGNLSDNSGFIYHPGDWPEQDQHGGPIKYASIICAPGCKATSATITY